MQRQMIWYSVALFAVGCASTSVTEDNAQPVPVESVPVEVVESAPALGEIWIAIEATPGDGVVMVDGKTNLPDGYVLSLSACRYNEGPDAPRCRRVDKGDPLQGRDVDVAVQDGAFSVELSPIVSVDDVKVSLQESWATEQEISQITGTPVDESGLTYTTDFIVDPQVTITVSGVMVDQPSEVLEVIGEKGENLSGLIVEDGVTGRSVRYRIKVDM